MVKDKKPTKSAAKKSAAPKTSKPSLPELAPFVPTGDAAIDVNVAPIMSYDDGIFAAMKALGADRRPAVVQALRERVTAVANAIVPVSTSIKGNTYMNMYGETEHRLRLLGPFLEALAEHHDSGAEGQLVALMQSHKDERVRYYAARCLLGQRLATGPGAWDPALRASRASLVAVQKWGEARPAKDILARTFATTAKQFLAT